VSDPTQVDDGTPVDVNDFSEIDSVEVGDAFECGPLKLTFRIEETGSIYFLEFFGQCCEAESVSQSLRAMADRIEGTPVDRPDVELRTTGKFNPPAVNFATGQPLADGMANTCRSLDELFSMFQGAALDSWKRLSPEDKMRFRDKVPLLVGAMYASARSLIRQKREISGNLELGGPTPPLLPVVLGLLRTLGETSPPNISSYARSYVDDLHHMHAMSAGEGKPS